MNISMMFAWVERFGPAGAAIAVAGGTFAVTDHVEQFRGLSAWGAMTFGFVTAGFAGAQRNTLISNPRSNVIRRAVRTGIYRRMLGYFNQSVYAGLCLVLISVALFVTNSDSDWWKWLFAVSTGMIVWVTALAWRNEMITSRVIQQYLEDRQHLEE